MVWFLLMITGGWVALMFELENRQQKRMVARIWKDLHK